jgi:hypothetical protein
MRVDHLSLEVVHARARRQRAEMVWQLLIAPVLRVFQKHDKPATRTIPLRGRLA